jgi:hypothetical protein
MIAKDFHFMKDLHRMSGKSFVIMNWNRAGGRGL